MPPATTPSHTRRGPRARRLRPLLFHCLAPTLIAAGTVLAGCGSSGSAGNADPATVTPASAPLYASITIKPSGGAKGVASSVAKTLTHLAEPYGSLAQGLLSSEGSHLEFKRDIEPWVGDRTGVFITSLDTSKLPRSATSPQALLEGGLTSGLSSLGAGAFGSKGAQGAIVLDASDLTGARSFLAQRAREQQAHAASYRGVSYQVSASGVAEGIVKGFAVIGSESGLRSVIDTSLGGAAVTTAPGYAKPPADAIASAYVQPEALLKAVHGSGGATSQGVSLLGLSLLGQLFAGSQSASVSVTPTANSISLQGEVHSASGSTPLFGQEGAQALGELPAGAWLAAGVANTGANLPRALALLRGVASLGTSTVFASLGGASIEKLFGALGSPSAKLQQDFGSWAGSAGMFVSGTGLFNLQAALVIASKDPAASRAAVGKLANLMRSAGATVSSASIPGTDAAASVRLQGFPAVIFIADGQGKFVLGLGQASVQGALTQSSTLSGSAPYGSSAAALGEGIEPSLIVEFPTLLGFLESIGLTQSPGVSNLVPYLKSLGTLTAGAVTQSGVTRFRLVLGLAPTVPTG
ncbi:MAG TPA: DUF3352 domain-containing protein [Solirubrobacteraceae bacterium]|nr:DUF3352 domain-containing protein [Solirubrobacteraceae bacterium]